jgi:alpha-glucosidase
VWEWWHNWSLEGVDFETGVNEATYRYYIDFAADNNIPYILFDAGWLTNRAVWVTMPDIHEKILEKSPYLNVKKVIEYAHSKNVKVILRCLGQTLNLYGDKAIPLMESYGADGLKVDFFDRDDQKAMELHYRIAKIAAENKLLVDFHGCAKPAFTPS